MIDRSSYGYVGEKFLLKSHESIFPSMLYNCKV